mgnify:CR=1 FL=1
MFYIRLICLKAFTNKWNFDIIKQEKREKEGIKMNEIAVTIEAVTHTRVSVSEIIARNSGLFIIPKKET